MSDKETHIVQSISTPIRFQEYGIGIFEQIKTKSALKKAIKKGWITINGKKASTATYMSNGDIVIFYPEKTNTLHKKFEIKLEVLFEDEYLAVINKPAGVLVSGNSFKTITNALNDNIKKSFLKDSCTPQPVHRLDFPTTGLLMIGKTKSSILALNTLFKDKRIQKTYYAITIGKMKSTPGTITTPIDGKNAESDYQVIKSTFSPRFENLNLVKLNPKTGRKHQLRKHLFEIGNPILGDKDYFNEGKLLQGKGLYLHAQRLEFKHPFTGQEITIESNLPHKFDKIFQNKKEY